MMLSAKSFCSRGKYILPLLLMCTFLISACGNKEPEEPEVIHLTYAVLNEKALGEAIGEVKRFNRAHPGIQIELKEYFNEDGRRGKDRLLTEIMAGQMPDIIHLGDDLSDDRSADTASRLPYHSLARKGYLEDLWPYIENDPDLGRDGVVEGPLKAAEVDGGLYTIFSKVDIQATPVSEKLVGDRKSWTLSEMLELFRAMPEEAVMFPYWVDRDYALHHVFSNSIESYVDRDSGTCSFTSDKFKSALEFVSGFPAESQRSSDSEDELSDQIRSGRLMQYPFRFSNPSFVQWADTYLGYGGKTIFLGVPTEDGSSGTYFRLKSKPLAMSSACQHKEAAWEFLRGTLLSRYKNYKDLEKDVYSFSFLYVNRADYDLIVRASRANKHRRMVVFGNLPASALHKAKEEDVARFEDLLNRTEQIDLYDDEIYNIIYEVSGAYFAGDKPLDETAQLIQDRVSLYLKEQM